MQTLGKLIEACELKSGFKSSEYRPNWILFLNESIREFARVQPWPGLEATVDLTTDGTKYLVLPHYVDTVVSLFNVTKAHRVDREGDWDRNSPSIEANDTGGPVIAYDRVGYVPLTKDPAGYLWFKSSNTSDIQTVSVTGLVANSGVSNVLSRTMETVTVYATGTSPVTVSALFTKVIALSRSTEADGDFYFYDAGSSDELVGFIGKDEISSAFQRLQLQYVPTSAQTLRLRYRYKLPRLVAETSSTHPCVSEDFVINHALSLHYAEQEQLSKAQAQEAKAGRVVQQEANKDENFSEPYSRITPLFDIDPDDESRT